MPQKWRAALGGRSNGLCSTVVNQVLCVLSGGEDWRESGVRSSSWLASSAIGLSVLEQEVTQDCQHNHDADTKEYSNAHFKGTCKQVGNSTIYFAGINRHQEGKAMGYIPKPYTFCVYRSQFVTYSAKKKEIMYRMYQTLWFLFIKVVKYLIVVEKSKGPAGP